MANAVVVRGSGYSEKDPVFPSQQKECWSTSTNRKTKLVDEHKP